MGEAAEAMLSEVELYREISLRTGATVTFSTPQVHPYPTQWRDVFERREGLVAAGALAGIVACGVWLWRRRRRQHRGPHARYERALRLLARRGVARAPEQSALELTLHNDALRCGEI